MAATNKGIRQEETLRAYFSANGHYAVRGVKLRYNGYDITDIDIWLYARTSSIARHIAIVDAKNRKTPQSMERILWTKGLAAVVNANQAIVATTDKRSEVDNYGRQNNVLVLGGDFLAKITQAYAKVDKITEEEFEDQIKQYEFNKVDGNWLGKMSASKTRLAIGLNFNSCNFWLENIKFFIEQAVSKPSNRDIALRCIYRLMSFLCIGIDNILAGIAFRNADTRKAEIREGFTFGDRGRASTLGLIETAAALLNESPNNKNTNISMKAQKEFDKLRTNILAEYFARNEIGRELFNLAVSLEHHAFEKDVLEPLKLSSELKSLTGVLLDYFEIDRRIFLNGVIDEQAKNTLQKSEGDKTPPSLFDNI